METIVTIMALTLTGSTLALAQKPGDQLHNPSNPTLLLIDHQPQMAFVISSISIVELRNKVTATVKSATAFNVSTTIVAEKMVSSPMFPHLPAAFPRQNLATMRR